MHVCNINELVVIELHKWCDYCNKKIQKLLG